MATAGEARHSGRRPPRLPLGVLLLTLVAAFSFGAVVTVARGAHFHGSGYSCNSQHGMVHGNSTNDGSWHGRVEQGTCPPTYHECHAAHISVGRIVSHGTFYGTCNAHYNGSRAEPFGYAEVWYEAQIPRHEHYAH